MNPTTFTFSPINMPNKEISRELNENQNQELINLINKLSNTIKLFYKDTKNNLQLNKLLDLDKTKIDSFKKDEIYLLLEDSKSSLEKINIDLHNFLLESKNLFLKMKNTSKSHKISFANSSSKIINNTSIGIINSIEQKNLYQYNTNDTNTNNKPKLSLTISKNNILDSKNNNLSPIKSQYFHKTPVFKKQSNSTDKQQNIESSFNSLSNLLEIKVNKLREGEKYDNVIHIELFQLLNEIIKLINQAVIVQESNYGSNNINKESKNVSLRQILNDLKGVIDTFKNSILNNNNINKNTNITLNNNCNGKWMKVSNSVKDIKKIRKSTLTTSKENNTSRGKNTSINNNSIDNYFSNISAQLNVPVNDLTVYENDYINDAKEKIKINKREIKTGYKVKVEKGVKRNSRNPSNFMTNSYLINTNNTTKLSNSNKKILFNTSSQINFNNDKTIKKLEDELKNKMDIIKNENKVIDNYKKEINEKDKLIYEYKDELKKTKSKIKYKNRIFSELTVSKQEVNLELISNIKYYEELKENYDNLINNFKELENKSQTEISKYSNELTELNNLNINLHLNIKKIENENINLLQSYKKKENDYNDLLFNKNELIINYENIISDLKKEILNLNQKINDTKDSFNDNQLTIDKLNNDINSLKNEVKLKDEIINNQENKEIKDLKDKDNEINDKVKYINELENQIKEKDKIYFQLNTENINNKKIIQDLNSKIFVLERDSKDNSIKKSKNFEFRDYQIDNIINISINISSTKEKENLLNSNSNNLNKISNINNNVEIKINNNVVNNNAVNIINTNPNDINQNEVNIDDINLNDNINNNELFLFKDINTNNENSGYLNDLVKERKKIEFNLDDNENEPNCEGKSFNGVFPHMNNNLFQVNTGKKGKEKEKDRLTEYKNNIKSLLKENEKFVREVEKLKQDLKKKSQILSINRMQFLREKESINNELKNKNEKFEKEKNDLLNKFKEELKKKDNNIGILNKSYQILNTKNIELECKIELKNEECSKLSKENYTLFKENKKLVSFLTEDSGNNKNKKKLINDCLQQHSFNIPKGDGHLPFSDQFSINQSIYIKNPKESKNNKNKKGEENNDSINNKNQLITSQKYDILFEQYSEINKILKHYKDENNKLLDENNELLLKIKLLNNEYNNNVNNNVHTNSKNEDDFNLNKELIISDYENKIIQIKTLIEIIIVEIGYNNKIAKSIHNLLVLLGYSQEQAENHYCFKDKGSIITMFSKNKKK